MHERIIISDASPIIALAGIGKLEILQKLYHDIIITDIVRHEIHAVLPDWISLNTNYDI